MRFKQGQTVRVKRGFKDGDYSSRRVFFNDEMEKLVGTILTIDKYINDGNISVKENRWNWDVDFFEVVEFSKDLITDLSVVRLDNGDKLLYIKDKDEFVDLKYGQDNQLCDFSDVYDDGYVNGGNHIIKVEQPTYASINLINEVKEMNVEEISKALGYEVKIKWNKIY